MHTSLLYNKIPRMANVTEASYSKTLKNILETWLLKGTFKLPLKSKVTKTRLLSLETTFSYIPNTFLGYS